MRSLVMSTAIASVVLFLAGCQTTGAQTNLAEASAETELTSDEAATADEAEEVMVASKETVAVSDPDYDPDEIICKRVRTTGSRLSKGQDCRTAKQWRDTMTNAQRAIGVMQTQDSGFRSE